MIDFIKGIAVHSSEDFVIIEVGGIGYRVFSPNPYDYPLQEEVTAYIHHHVRDDAILLYGFPTREAQSLFRRLIEVSGIGPRVALGIMSGASLHEIVTAVEQENVPLLVKLPGVGKKTAQRMILDLKGKLQSLVVADDDGESVFQAESKVMNSSLTANWQEARSGLAALGYLDQELDQAEQQLQGQMDETDSVDTLIKRALKVLYENNEI